MGLILRHSVRASVITGILFSALLRLVGLLDPLLWIAATAGLVVACVSWSTGTTNIASSGWTRKRKPVNVSMGLSKKQL